MIGEAILTRILCQTDATVARWNANSGDFVLLEDAQSYALASQTIRDLIASFGGNLPLDMPETPDVCIACARLTDNCECQRCDNCDARFETVCSCCDSDAVCSECCGCQDCSSCGNRTADCLCPVCEKCSDCCQCITCSGCDERFPESASICERCSRCESPTIGRRWHDGCCECCHCASCSHAVESTCSNCDYCENCCECIFCSRCGESVGDDSYCSECERCEGCCNCEDGPTTGGKKHGPRCTARLDIQRPPNPRGYSKNRLRRAVAIELELSDVGAHGELLAWAKKTGAGLVKDGSIPERGCEINSQPAAGDLFISGMLELVRVLKASEVKTNEDCGLHVHVEAADYTQNDLRRVMMLWAGVERAMFELVDKSRIGSDYCSPCGSLYAGILTARNIIPISTKSVVHLDISDNWRQRLARVLYGCADRSLKETKKEKYPSGDARPRYQALSLHAYNLHKTIEFRISEASLSETVLACYPLVCAHIVEYASTHSENAIMRLLRSQMTSEQILASILPIDLKVWTRAKLQARIPAYIEDLEHIKKLASLEAGRQMLASQVLWKPVRHVESKPMFTGLTTRAEVSI